jgi:amino acid adenylation domain-containing protein
MATPNLRELDADKLAKLVRLAGERRGRTNADNNIPVVARGGLLTPSFAQHRLWLIAQLEGTSTNYHVRGALRLTGRLDVEAWRRSLDHLFARHEALRSVFVRENEELRVALLPEEQGMPFAFHDLSGDPDPAAALDRCLGDDELIPFDLARGPLVRSRMFRLADTHHVFALTLHHLVCDGWSIGVLVRELCQLYEAFTSGRDASLPPLTIQYPDFAEWQRRWLSGERLERQAQYWRKALDGAPAALELTADRPRPKVRSLGAASVPVEIEAELAEGVRELSRRHGVTPFMTLLAAWAAVLSRLAGQSDVVIGTPVANRRRREVEGLIGFFVNMLPLRLDLSGEPHVAELLDRVRTTTLSAQDHQDIPFEHLVELIEPPRRTDQTPVFQVVFAWQNNEAEAFTFPGLSVATMETPVEQVKFDLELNLAESDGRIAGTFKFARALFDPATIEAQRDALIAALRAMVGNAHQAVDRIDLLPPAERVRLIETWNDTDVPYPAERCVHELVADHALRNPDATAVVDDTQALTYGDLDRRANRLARYLIDAGVGPDVVVAVCVGRTIAMPEAVLSVLKAGGAYLPLDPKYPRERLRQIVGDAKPVVLVVDREGRAALGDLPCRAIDLEAEDRPWEALPATAPDVRASGLTSRKLAYIIYTSGSTGTPKGVMVEHRGVINLAQAQQALFNVTPQSRIVQFASFSFDASAWDMVMALCAGAELHIAGSHAQSDPDAFLELVVNRGITHATLPPALLQGRTDLDRLKSLEVLVLAGELPKVQLVAALPRNIAVFNGYGPTETTVCATTWRRPDGFDGETVPIGRPIPNTRVYLLDRHGAPVPRGAVGEICIGGAGVARGYLNRPDLTDERFIRDTFSADEDGRVYRTGDLGRYRADGIIEFLGRNDHQVKIRGFRIELGEIEHHLIQHQSVRDAVVLALPDPSGDQRLVAYVVRTDAQSGSAAAESDALSAELRRQLGTHLPDYMVPSAFVEIDALPQTPNGKVDRRRLPVPGAEALGRAAYVAPVGETEEILAGIWSDLLGVERVGRNDHFFELGGHSLLAVRLQERLRKHGFATDVRTLFASPVLSELAASLVRDDVVAVPVNRITATTPAIRPDMLPLIELTQADINAVVATVPGGVANIQDIYALSPLQDGILYHHLLATRGDPYLLTGQMAFASRDLLDRYLAAMQRVVDRHDVLRTGIVWDGLSRPAQVVWRTAPLAVRSVELDGEGTPREQFERCLDLRESRIDLTQPPLVQFIIAPEAGSKRWLLTVLLHHLIGDHSTLEIMNDEVQKMLAGREHELLPPAPFRNMIARARSQQATEETERFFRSMLHDIDEPTAPFDLHEVRGDGHGIDEARRALPAELNEKLRFEARRLGVSVASLCHVAWGRVIAQTSGRENVVFGTVMLDRMHAGAGGDRTMGLFINTLPLRLDLDGTGIEDSVRTAHDRLGDLMGHVQASLASAQRLSGVAPPQPLFSAILNYRHSGLAAGGGGGTFALMDGVEWLGGEERTNFPLMLAVDDAGDALSLNVQVARPHSADRIAAFMERALESLAGALASAPNTPVCEIDVLPAVERERLVREWNQTEEGYPSVPLHMQFETRAAEAADRTALVFGGERLSYGELNGRANALARRLRAAGVGPECVVALALERGVEMMVALLAVLKAGGAYLPLDPDYPADRLTHMLADSGATLLLTQESLRERFGGLAGAAEIWLCEEAGDVADAGPLDVAVHPESLAYVIYTSGSTGLPKGVMVRHDAVSNFLAAMAAAPGIKRDDRVLGLTSLSFDIAVLELFLPLTAGATVVLADREAARDPDRLKDIIIANDVTMIQATPATWRMLADHDGASGLRWLKPGCRVLSGGEALAADLAQRLVAAAGEVWNLYGPTETTVWSARRRLNAQDSRPVLGGPIGNTTLYVLDDALNVAPVGVAGELYIGGAGLARGYWQRGGLTAERFIPDPFGPPGARLYRTGDIARWGEDGALAYVGRSDHQVKIRGHRIEPGEIEAALAQQPGVRSAVVVARALGGGRQLVGYVTGDGDLDGHALKAALAARLPAHMVPARVVVLDGLPLTPNGKVDRKALPDPDAASSVAAYIAPRTAAEAALAAIWSELLQRPQVGVTDNFFELGGDSLTAVQLISRIKTELGHDVPLHRLFEMTTIETMAAALSPQDAVQKRSDDIAAMLDTLNEIETTDE